MDKILFFLFLVISINGQSNEKIEINADQFTYDKENTRIYATGNVEIIDKEFKLYANKVFVNNESKVLSARENIKIFNADGSILKADKIVADNTLENALIENNHLYIPKMNKEKKYYMRLAAKKVERRNKDWERLQYGTFTACEICYNQKKKKYDPPLVQLKAKKIIHDKKNQYTCTHNSSLQKGVYQRMMGIRAVVWPISHSPRKILHALCPFMSS